MWSFLQSCVPNFIYAPLLHCWHRVKIFPTATLLNNSQNIFQTFDTKEAAEFNMFQFRKHFSSLALETGTVNNNLISTLLQSLILGDIKIIRHVTRYETLTRERVLFAYSTTSCYCSKRLGIDTFIPASFNGIRNCYHMEKS